MRDKFEVSIGDNPFNVGPLKIGGTIAGVEGNYSYGINSGRVSSVKGTGILSDLVKIDQ